MTLFDKIYPVILTTITGANKLMKLYKPECLKVELRQNRIS